VLKDCLVGAIEARFGPINDEGASTPTLSLTVSFQNSSSSVCKADSITDCCADGSVQESAAEAPLSARSLSPPGRAQNFEQFIYSVWGSGVAKHFALPYNRKLWAVPLTEMETSWLGGRVPLPNLTEMIEGALRPVAKPMGPNARFGYPLKGGFQALVEGFLPHLRGELKLNARVTRITPSEHEVTLADGSTYRYEQLISTMPLPVLIRVIGDEAPPRIRVAAAALRHVSVRCVNLGVGRPKVTDKHWIYYPGDSVFHRIFVQGNASEHVNAHGGFGLTCEITYSAHKPLPCEGDELIDLCIADCVRVGLLRADDQIIARNQVDMPYAYVVYDHTRAENVEVIRRWLGLQDIHLAGRYGEWEYYNSDHAFLAGRKAAEIVGAALSERASSADLAGSPSSRSQTVST
jgi:UDP-galactopyranose mutase